MRKALLLVCVVLLMGLGIPVLAQDATPEATEAAAEPWVCPEGFEGQTLSVYNWSTYIAEDTVANFEAACGVTVNYDVYASNEELLARLRGGNPGYDIIVPTDYMVAIMIEEELLEPIERANIPNFANVSENLLNPPYDPENAYSVPYQWGTAGIGYNIEAVGEEITSWEQLFSYEGAVAWIEDPRVMMANALIVLGYDPNTENPDEIAAARDFLIERGGNVTSIAVDDGQAQLERGDVDVVIEYSGDIYTLIYDCECETYAYVIPEEGANIWIDSLAIPVGAPNKALAEAFIDYILDPQVSADISNYTAYATPNQAAIDQALIDEELLANPGIYPSDELRERLFFVEPVTDDQPYLDAWDEVKILLGQ